MKDSVKIVLVGAGSREFSRSIIHDLVLERALHESRAVEVRITFDLATDISNWHVLIIEDIVDSGYTLASVLALLTARNPKSIHICTLLDKAERREVDVPIRYTGFIIPNEFVFGYGLDIDDFYRNLPFIASVDLDKFLPE